MAEILTVVLAAVQTVVVIVTAFFAWINIRKFKDARGVDFILNAESKIDPIYQTLVESPPSVIRSIYASYELTDLSDT